MNDFEFLKSKAKKEIERTCIECETSFIKCHIDGIFNECPKFKKFEQEIAKIKKSLNSNKKTKGAKTVKHFTPSPALVAEVRKNAGMTLKEAAAVLHYDHLKTWHRWETGERTMSLCALELFLIKTKQKKLLKELFFS